MAATVTVTMKNTAPPVMAFIIFLYPSPLVEKRVIIAVCKPRTDIMADTKFRILAADRMGLSIFRNLTRFMTDSVIIYSVYNADR